MTLLSGTIFILKTSAKRIGLNFISVLLIVTFERNGPYGGTRRYSREEGGIILGLHSYNIFVFFKLTQFF